MKVLKDNKEISSWLSEYHNKITKRNMRLRIKDFLNAVNMNPEDFIKLSSKEAKHIVKEKVTLIKRLNPVDAGGTLSARHVERFTAFLIGINVRYKTHDSGITITGLPPRDW